MPSGLLYCSGFQVSASAAMTATVAGSPASIANGYYMPAMQTSLVYPTPGVSWTGAAYTNFTTAVKSAFDAATGSTFTVTFSTTTGLYTISRATTFTLTFSSASDLRLRAALGFTGDKSGSNSYTSDAVPAYVVRSEILGRTNVMGQYEPDDIAEETVSDGGEAFVVTRKTNEFVMTWQQSMEPRTAVYEWAAYKAASNSSIPWSWQQWFAHTRGTHPFYVNDTLEGESNGAVFRLTASGASFRPQRVTADYDDQWIVPFEARWLGRYN